MNKEITFGRWEAISLLIVTISTQIVLNTPRTMAEIAGTAGWILTIYVSILVFLLFTLIVKLYSKFEGKDLLDISEYVGGNTGRIIVGCILTPYLIFILFVVLREFGENMKIIALTDSPISFVMLFFLAGMIIGSYLGIEAIVRVGAIAVPIIILGYLVIIIGASQFFDISRIMPVLGAGPYEIFVKGAPRISIFSGVLVLFFVYPFIKTKKNFKTVGYTVILMASFFFTASTLAFLLVYQYPTATEVFLPIYQLARLINYGSFFQRIESIFMIIWVTSALIYMSFVLFFVVYIFKKTFKLQYYKPLIFPFGIIVYTLSFLPSNLVTAIEFETKYFRQFAWIVTYAMTILILVLANIKANLKKEKKQNGGK